eukprot:11188854-Lingulodinium_polyedra.AAC.1
MRRRIDRFSTSAGAQWAEMSLEADEVAFFRAERFLTSLPAAGRRAGARSSRAGGQAVARP